MTMMVEKSDFEELARTLSNIGETISFFQGGDDRAEVAEECRKLVQSFHTTAAMLGLDGLALAGQGLEAHIGAQLSTNGDGGTMPLLGSKLRELSKRLELVEDAEGLDNLVDSVKAVVGDGADHSRGEELSTASDLTNLSGGLQRLERIVQGLGGTISCTKGETGIRSVVLQFEAVPSIVEKIETLLSPWDPEPGTGLAPHIEPDNPKIQGMVESIKEFMKALSEGSWAKAQHILLELSEHNSKTNLYNEIGSLARQLHSSLKNVTETLDPDLKEMVESKIPDSGSRLEHIMELTERSANLTLDNVEVIQRRNQEAETCLMELRKQVIGLRAISPQAQENLDSILSKLDTVMSTYDQNRDDLFAIMTAQDYQDLSGQIIMKIITLLKDLEKRLINVVRVFGGRGGPVIEPAQDVELYGPAHKGREEALHSQDDVDSLLADFGF
jgi:chemotaxis protein CheZ